jgi:ribosome-associated protein
MAVSLPEIKDVGEICRLLEEHKGGNVTALDLRKLHSWTDFFIIATVSSGAHLHGLLRHIRDFARERDLSTLRGQGKNGGEEGWSLVDMGTAVIHLMTAPFREFYELEELWGQAEKIYPLPPEAPPPGAKNEASPQAPEKSP